MNSPYVFEDIPSPPRNETRATARDPLSRSSLTAAISADEAATRRIVGDLEPDRTTAHCYTSITFLPEGEILLTCCRGRDIETDQDGKPLRRHQVLARLKVGVFNESWLRD